MGLLAIGRCFYQKAPCAKRIVNVAGELGRKAASTSFGKRVLPNYQYGRLRAWLNPLWNNPLIHTILARDSEYDRSHFIRLLAMRHPAKGQALRELASLDEPTIMDRANELVKSAPLSVNQHSDIRDVLRSKRIGHDDFFQLVNGKLSGFSLHLLLKLPVDDTSHLVRDIYIILRAVEILSRDASFMASLDG
ncbi:hypothetical protein ACFL5U_03365 [Candidatus Margulisiibacteriota bacterium]